MAQAQLSPMRMKVKDVIAKSKGTKFEGVKEKHYPVMVNKAEMGALNAMKQPIHERKKGGFIDQMVKKGLNDETYIMKGTEPKAVAAPMAVMRGQGAETVESGTERRDYGTSASAGLDNPIHNQPSGGGDGGSSQQRAPQMTREQAMQRFGLMESVDLDAMKKTAADEALQTQRDSARQGYVDKFDAYSDKFGSLGDQFDLSKERDSMQDLAGEAQRLGTQYGNQMSGVTGRVGGYEGDVAGLRSGVDTLRQQQAGIGQQIGGLAQQAMDPTSSPMYERNRQMLSGVAEQQRNASNRAALEQLNRSAAGSGLSPEKLAMMRAQVASGQGAQARQDALSSAMGAQQMTGQQLAQGAGLLGQQAGLGMQQANLYGQQAGLGAQAAGLAGQQAGMFGQAAGFQSGLIGQRGGLMGQSAGLLQQQLMGKGQMLGQQAGMTTYGLQDVVARQNEAMQLEMMEKTNAANIEAARYGSRGGGGGGGFLSSITSSIGL
jgi:hypothetical protein